MARDLAILADVVRDVPGARLHLTHVSTAGALDLIRRAKAAGLPVTCDVTPHHLALTDEWVAGAAALGLGRPTRRPVGATTRSRASPYDSSLRVNPPLRAPEDAAAVPGRAARRHGRRGRHRPRAAHRGRQGGRVRRCGERDQRHRDGAGAAARGRRRRARCRWRGPSRR